MSFQKQESIQQFFEDVSYHMINVGEKMPTKRKALAQGKIVLSNEVYNKVRDKTLAKGDVIPLSEIAGINGAKHTASLLPLCHPLPLEQVSVKNELNFEDNSIVVYCYVEAYAKTGVEMEALAGVQAALLCIYDVCKMYGHEMCLEAVRLLYKEGGKSQQICFPEYLPQTLSILAKHEHLRLENRKAAILTVSDRAAEGIYPDKSGPLLKTILEKNGVKLVGYEIIPDETQIIQEQVASLVSEKSPDLLFTTGGTGVGPRDVTPEALGALIDYEIPGVGELLRSDGAKHTPYAWLSRTKAGLYKKTLIISLPGSTNAIKQGMIALSPLLPHLLMMLEGKGHA